MYKEYCIYIHKNRQNNKVYIGQTCQKPQRRWKKGKGYKNCYYFFNAINKYGWDSFEHIILKQHLTLEEANYWEKYYIQKYNSTNPQFGYNIREGGNTISEKYREVICLNTKEIFNTISDAAEKYLNNRSEGHISSVCKGTRAHAGEIGDEFLSWAYLDEYLDNPDRFKNKKFINNIVNPRTKYSGISIDNSRLSDEMDFSDLIKQNKIGECYENY